jgi:hypothetical protein
MTSWLTQGHFVLGTECHCWVVTTSASYSGSTGCGSQFGDDCPDWWHRFWYSNLKNRRRLLLFASHQSQIVLWFDPCVTRASLNRLGVSHLFGRGSSLRKWRLLRSESFLGGGGKRRFMTPEKPTISTYSEPAECGLRVPNAEFFCTRCIIFSRFVEWIHMCLPVWFISETIKQSLNIDQSISISGTAEKSALMKLCVKLNGNGFRRDWKLCSHGIEKVVTAGPVALKWRAIIYKTNYV